MERGMCIPIPAENLDAATHQGTHEGAHQGTHQGAHPT
jgi:hypothetical protein